MSKCRHCGGQKESSDLYGLWICKDCINKSLEKCGNIFGTTGIHDGMYVNFNVEDFVDIMDKLQQAVNKPIYEVLIT